MVAYAAQILTRKPTQGSTASMPPFDETKKMKNERNNTRNT